MKFQLQCTFNSLASIVPDPSVSNKSKASLISWRCSSVSSGLGPPFFLAPPPANVVFLPYEAWDSSKVSFMLFVQIEHNKCDTISDEIHVSFFIEQCISTVFLKMLAIFLLYHALKNYFQKHIASLFYSIWQNYWQIMDDYTQSINIYKFSLQTIR